MKTKTTDEYLKRGGIRGIAWQVLQDEFVKAGIDDEHPLHLAVKARNEGKLKEFEKLFADTIIKASEDDTSPLNLPAIMFFRFPMNILGFKRIETIFPEAAWPETFEEMAFWGLMHLDGEARGYKNSKRQGGLKKSQNLEFIRSKVCEDWDKFQFKNKGKQYFARHHFKKLGGEYDDEGDVVKNGIPTPNTIVRWITAHDKKKS